MVISGNITLIARAAQMVLTCNPSSGVTPRGNANWKSAAARRSWMAIARSYRVLASGTRSICWETRLFTDRPDARRTSSFSAAIAAIPVCDRSSTSPVPTEPCAGRRARRERRAVDDQPPGVDLRDVRGGAFRAGRGRHLARLRHARDEARSIARLRLAASRAIIGCLPAFGPIVFSKFARGLPHRQCVTSWWVGPHALAVAM